MSKRRRTIGLIAFLTGKTDPAAGVPGCANYDHHYGGCLFGEKCKVEKGQRCAYFEKAVLPTAAQIGLKKHIYSRYANQVGIDVEIEALETEIKRCPDCGAELKPRQKYCDTCSKRRRRESYTKSRRKAG
jgi:hypothetical protein